MASATGILSSGTGSMAPDVARRTWPRWVGLALLMLAVAVTAVLWDDAGSRLILGASGLFLTVRGALLLRGAGSGAMSPAVAGRARGLGTTAVVGGVLALAASAVSESVAATVLLFAVPLLLLAGGAALLSRGGVSRRGGQAVLVWAALATALLVATGFAQGWGRAADVATVVAALGVAVLAVPVLVGASVLRTVAARPAPAPARTVPAACAGCACGAGGCGA